MPVDRKRFKLLHRDLAVQGFEVRSGRKHDKVTHPSYPGVTVTMSASPSDERALENILGDLRRNFGYVAPWKKG